MEQKNQGEGNREADRRYRRGVRESEQFRALTNEMFIAAFGMDVEAYRRYKGLFRTRENLRDHMTDIELSLVSLMETTIVELHRRRRSSGFEALLLDAKDAGKIGGRTRRDIESESGGPIVSAANHLPRTTPVPATSAVATPPTPMAA